MLSRLIIKYLGGLKTVAGIVERDISSISRWRDLIPAKHQKKLLSYARNHGIDLRPEDFFYPERLQKLMQEKQTSPKSKFTKNPSVYNAGNNFQS